MGCDCGKPKCDGHCGVSPAVLQINNPSECVLFHRVEVPASMGDSKTNPPKSGAYKNVLLYYEADQTSWLYSSDGVPQKLVNGVTNYEDAINLPQINGVTLLGNKSLGDLGITDAIDDAVAEEKAEREAADEALGGEIDDINDELLSRAVTFDTVADMKTATNLVNGSYAQTLGFYTINDGGGALYKITDTGTANEMDIVAVDSLFANLINGVNPKQFGAYGDGTHDDTASMQAAINSGKPLTFDNATYMTTGIECVNNSDLTFNNTTIKMVTNALTSYRVLGIVEVNNVHLKGHVNLIGDYATHTGTSGEFGMCLSIIGSTNVTVESVHCEYGWGDGIYIDAKTDHTVNSKNVIINNAVCNNNRRNGMSICDGENIIIDNLITHDNHGTAPAGGLDIEPWHADAKIKVTIGYVYAYNNSVATRHYQAFITNHYTDYFDVSIEKLVIEGVLSMNVLREASKVTVKELKETLKDDSIEVFIPTSRGYSYFGDVSLDISACTNMTNKNLIYGDSVWNTYIENLTVINNGTSLPYFIVNGGGVKGLTINHLNYVGEFTPSNTQNTYIKINNFAKKDRNLNSADNRTIKPFDTNITITDELATISYNDIAQYDGYEFFITNNNTTQTVTVSLNLRKFLYNGNLSTTLSIPAGSVAKVHFDRISRFYIVEYLHSLT